MFQSVSLGQPLACAALIVVLPLTIFVARTRLAHARTGARVAVLALRLTVTLLVLAALAQPSFRPGGRGRAVVFALDRSDSISADQVSWARDWVSRAVESLPPGSRSSVIEFGARAQLAGAPDGLATDSTDLSAALKLAGTILAREPGVAPEIVLLTDGWDTTGAAPTHSVPAGTSVSYVQLPDPTTSEHPVAVVHAMDAPTAVRAGDTADTHLDLQSAQSVDARLRLSVNNSVVANGPIHLEPGESQLTLPAPIPDTGFASIRADLTVADQTSRLSRMIVVKPAGHVLVIQDSAADADAVVSLLAAQGLEVERRAATDVPPSASDLMPYDAAILVNVPATSLTLDQQRTLQSFVQDHGRGLVVVGGPHAFAPGGYQGTVLDEMLPVAAEPPVEPQQGSLALFLVIDRSGSMDLTSAGATKMAMAREAAIEAAGLLQPRDTLGVVAFDTSFNWVVPPTQLNGPDDVKTAQDKIATIKAGGGTSILPALQSAFEAAAASSAQLKHIVLMTDGESNDKGYEDLLARMAPAQVTLSTLAIGSDADTKLLTSLAHLGGGRYYFTERSTEIPRIASKETTILTRNAVVEGNVAAVVADPSPILRSISGDLPTLSGYVATTPRDRAITALETEHGHPLLAHWQYGLGRVVAWTSAAQQGWASEWANWPDAPRFWSQLVRWSLPSPISPSFEPSAEIGPDGRRVRLSVQSLNDNGTFADLQDTRATVVSPDGSARQIALPQRAPGEYALETRVSGGGDYRVLFAQGSKEEVAGFSAPDAVELHSVGTNTRLLDQLASISGGQRYGAPTELRPGAGQGPTIELWPWFLVAALLILPFDVLMRRRV